MLKSFRLTAALSVTLLALVSGCSNSESIKTNALSANSESSQPLANQTETGTTLENAGTNKPVEIAIAALPPDNPDPAINAEVLQFVNEISAEGFAKENQGIWIQSGQTLLANHQGTVALPAASVTKAATTLAALQTFNPDHQFVTLIGTTGSIENGVLQGDLVIQGGEDPFFVWEEAIALGNILNKLGINRVTGNLVIAGKFYMNFEFSPLTSGNFLKQGLNSQIWPAEAEEQYLTLPQSTPRPNIIIDGSVQVVSSPPNAVKPLVRHLSFPLAELLKKMNMYSNNLMAQMLADAVGGASVVAEKAAKAAGVPQAEVQLINGSGLGDENRISPRAAVGIFQAIEQYLKPYNLTIADVFAIAGKDVGVLNNRQIPSLSVVKTGTLDNVASIAGAMPTQTKGPVWVAIMNVGENLEGFRAQQDVLLTNLVNKWGTVASSPAELKPNPIRKSNASSNVIVKE